MYYKINCLLLYLHNFCDRRFPGHDSPAKKDIWSLALIFIQMTFGLDALTLAYKDPSAFFNQDEHVMLSTIHESDVHVLKAMLSPEPPSAAALLQGLAFRVMPLDFVPRLPPRLGSNISHSNLHGALTPAQQILFNPLQTHSLSERRQFVSGELQRGT